MATGLYDIKDRAEVLTPDEIEAGAAQCMLRHTYYITDPGSTAAIPLQTYVSALKARWTRAAQTARMIDNMRAGYCTIEPLGAPPQSGMTH